MKLGNTKINGFVCLAPMAGVTDRAFREICNSFSASYVVTEMVSAMGLECSSKKTEALIEISENEKPAVIQIFGKDPECMANAAKIAESKGCIAIDINMGCPAPKVSGHGGGSALMKVPDLASDIIKAVVQSVSIPVTVKMRSGWDETCINAVEIAKIAEKSGASAVTIHGRTKKQMYSPPVNYDIIKEVKQNVSIPVIGNGDIVDIESAKYMYDYTGCDFIMIGRGALGRPWIFSQLNSYFSEGKIIEEPTIEEKMDIMINHISKMCEYKGTDTGIKEARKHAGWYTKGLRGSAALRREIGTIENIEQLVKISNKIIEMNR